MDPEFWHSRWQAGRIGFHQDRPTPLLLEHWPALHIGEGERVFVPLCGKSLDMAWLATQCMRVLGAELSALAVDAFFRENAPAPEVVDRPYGREYRAGAITIVCGDVFALPAAALADCTAVMDRAALIALPPALRRRYVDEVYARLPRGCRGLLITLDYPPAEKQGPPFAVPDAEVHALFDRDWTVTRLARRDILAEQPGFAEEGITALHTSVFQLERR